MPITLEHPCQQIVQTAVHWVQARLRDMPDDTFFTWVTLTSLLPYEEALDTAALSLDEAATRQAARAYCQAWEQALRAHGWLPRKERPAGWKPPAHEGASFVVRLVKE